MEDIIYVYNVTLAHNTVGIRPGKLSYKLRTYRKGRTLQISCTAPFKSLAICFWVIVETQTMRVTFSDCLQTWTLLFWPRTILVSSLKLTEDHGFCHFLQQNSSPFWRFNGQIVISYIFCKIKHDHFLYNSAINQAINQWTLAMCL